MPVEKSRSPRNELLKQLYKLYVSQPEQTKKENSLRYKSWMTLNHPDCVRKAGFSLERYNSHKSSFKKSKVPPLERYIPIFSEKFFAIKMAHLKGEDGLETLRHMISVARDIKNRDGNVAQYILGSIKVVE